MSSLPHKPLFLIGPPRSGTTILTQVLNVSNKILITDELRIFGWIVKEIRKINAGHDMFGDPYPFNNNADIASYLQSNTSHFLLGFYKDFAKKNKKEDFIYWGDKYPHFDKYLPMISRMFPRASYVLILRKLSEVVNSVMVGHKWSKEDSTKYVIDIYKNYLETISKIKKDKLFAFNYDYLKEKEPVPKISEIFEFLDLPLSKADEKKIIKILSYQSHTVRGKKKVGKKFSKNKSKLILKPEEVESINNLRDVKMLNKETEKRFSIQII